MSSLYRVEVFRNGRRVSTYRIEAVDALRAINAVEAHYGDPPQVAYKTIFHEDGTQETVLVVSGWHGYSFLARAVNEGTAA